MPSGTVDRRLASFCTSRLRAVRMQAKSDRNYPVLPYMIVLCISICFTAYMFRVS